MDGNATADALFFAGFRFDRRGGVLFRLNGDGAAVPIELGSRSIDLLRVLIDKPGELVSKDAIMRAVWPGRVVEEANLNVQISKLRRVLDHDREHGRCIQTVPGRGYRFTDPVRRADSEPNVEMPGGMPAQPREQKDEQVITNIWLSPERLQQMIKEAVSDAGRLPMAE